MGVGGGYSVQHDERYAGGSRPYGTVDRLRPLACVFVRIGIISTAFLQPYWEHGALWWNPAHLLGDHAGWRGLLSLPTLLHLLEL